MYTVKQKYHMILLYMTNHSVYTGLKRHNNLRLHMMKHTGENPYKCIVCDYSTQRRNNLRLHMIKHRRETLQV